jgi:hypothetical protein
VPTRYRTSAGIQRTPVKSEARTSRRRAGPMASVTGMPPGDVLDSVILSPVDFAERLGLSATLPSTGPPKLAKAGKRAAESVSDPLVSSPLVSSHRVSSFGRRYAVLIAHSPGHPGLKMSEGMNMCNVYVVGNSRLNAATIRFSERAMSDRSRFFSTS